MSDCSDKPAPSDEVDDFVHTVEDGENANNGKSGEGRDDERGGIDPLLGEVYEQLRSLAQTMMSREQPGQTLQATALVHEAYVRLSDENPERWQNQRHFYFVAAQAMRRILVDRARRQGRLKHGGGHTRISLDEIASTISTENIDLVDLDDAIRRFSLRDRRAGHLITLRYFAGLSLQEAAAALEIPLTTARRDWNYARAWLARDLGTDDESDERT